MSSSEPELIQKDSDNCGLDFWLLLLLFAVKFGHNLQVVGCIVLLYFCHFAFGIHNGLKVGSLTRSRRVHIISVQKIMCSRDAPGRGEMKVLPYLIASHLEHL